MFTQTKVICREMFVLGYSLSIWFKLPDFKDNDVKYHSQTATVCRLLCLLMFNHSTLTTHWIWILLTKYNATKAYLTITDLNLCHVCKTAHGASRTYNVLVGSRSCSRRIVCLFKRDLHYLFSFFNNDFLPNVVFYSFFRTRLSL